MTGHLKSRFDSYKAVIVEGKSGIHPVSCIFGSTDRTAFLRSHQVLWHSSLRKKKTEERIKES